MANPTGLWSTIVNSYQTAQIEIGAAQALSRKKTFDTLYSFADKLGPLKTIGRGAVCILFPEECSPTTIAKNILSGIPIYVAYEVPKMAFESVTSATFWGARTIYNIGSGFAEWFIPAVENAAPSKLEKVYDALVQHAEKVSLDSTSWATGRSVTDLASDIAYGGSNFKAVDLIGPALFLSLCANKALVNLFEALHHGRLLVMNRRMVSTAFESPAINLSAPGAPSNIAIVEKTRRYTAARLFKDAAMESIFTAAWTTGAFFSYHGIFNAILTASGDNAQQASYVANTVLTAGIMGPILYGWVEEALYMPSSETEHKNARIAPHLDKTDPIEKELIDINKAETLTHEEKMKFIEKYRPVINPNPANPATDLNPANPAIDLKNQSAPAALG
jgi:hypothetical protein